MKILVINALDFNYGSTYRMRLLRKNIVDLGHDVMYVESNFCEYGHSLGGSVSVKQKNSLISYLIASFRRMGIAFFEKYDILIISKALPVAILPMLAALIRRKKIILDWDDLEAYFQVSPFRRNLILLFERIFAIMPVRFTTHSSFIDQYIRRLGVKNVDYLPQAVSDSFFTEGNGLKYRSRYNLKDSIVFGYVTTFTIGSLYDFDLVLDLYEKFLQKYSNAVLLVAGDGPLYSQVEMSLRLRRFDRAFLVGLLDKENMVDFLAACNAGLIAMSAKHLSNEARVSFKMLEYAAAGKPVFGNVVGESAKILGQYVHDISSLDNPCNFSYPCEHIRQARDAVAADFSELSMRSALKAILQK